MKTALQHRQITDKTIEIDGSYGEGGGQIVRTACALSALTGISCRISKIRGGRHKPGLQPQHCTAVNGLASLCNAETSPIKIGKNEISFSPGDFNQPLLSLDIGSAGAISLVLQALLLAALGSSQALSITIRGGTDVPKAPSCDYVKNIKLAFLKKMGYPVKLEILKRGYYPKGGGIVKLHIEPPPKNLLEPLLLPEATDAIGSHGLFNASASLAKKQIGDKLRRKVTKTLTDYLHVPAKIEVQYGEALSPGCGLVLWAETNETIIGASALGNANSSAEQVGEEATEKLFRTYHTRAAVDPWMGDQILPYMALSRDSSVISVPYITRHMKTNMWLVQQFLKVRFYCEQENQRMRIHCQPLPTP